jgi:acetyl esterase/lipase
LLALGAIAGCGRTPYPARFAVDPDLPYLPYRSTKVDIVRLREEPSRPRPLAILVHGGGWSDGRKEEIVDLLCVPFVTAGFVVVNVDYRQSGEAPAPAAVADVIAASHWAMSNAEKWQADGGKTVIAGISAGGHLALMAAIGDPGAGLAPVPVRAVVNLAGIADVADLLEGPHRQPFAARWLPAEKQLSLARKLSPLECVRPGFPPVLTIHSSQDNVVPYAQATAFTEAVRRAGGVAELMTVNVPGHGFSTQNLPPLFPAIFAFLARNGIRP